MKKSRVRHIKNSDGSKKLILKFKDIHDEDSDEKLLRRRKDIEKRRHRRQSFKDEFWDIENR